MCGVGHELGAGAVAPPHLRPPAAQLAGEGPQRRRAAQGPADHRPADQQAGGPLEGEYRRRVPGTATRRAETQ